MSTWPACANSIADATVGCRNDDEVLTAFLVAIDVHIVGGAVPACLVGFDTTLVEIAHAENRRGLIARICHDARTYEVALFDIDVHAG